jgi:hypothetical protein
MMAWIEVMMAWIEVGKADCRECKGIGVDMMGLDLLKAGWTKRELLKRGHRCRACRGTGQRSVGYQS